jgi:hypothetical protein
MEFTCFVSFPLSTRNSVVAQEFVLLTINESGHAITVHERKYFHSYIIVYQNKIILSCLTTSTTSTGILHYFLFNNKTITLLLKEEETRKGTPTRPYR